MSAPTQDTRTLWATMPGWGIFTDLTPPEILASRRVASIRRYVSVGLVFLLVVVLLLFGFVTLKQRSASNELKKAEDDAQTLTVQLSKFSDVTTIQGTVASVEEKVSALLQADIDFPGLLASMQKALPPGVTLTQIAVTVTPPTAAGAGVPAPVTVGGSGAVLDPSTHAHIGSVTLSGTARKLTDVSAYVDKLATLNGVVEPYPASNTASEAGVQYNVQVTLTDQLFTHRFDAKKTGAN